MLRPPPPLPSPPPTALALLTAFFMKPMGGGGGGGRIGAKSRGDVGRGVGCGEKAVERREFLRLRGGRESQAIAGRNGDSLDYSRFERLKIQVYFDLCQ